MINNNKILDDITNKGYSTITSFFDEEKINAILKDAIKSKFKINENTSLGLFYETQYYFMNIIAESQISYDFITSKFVTDLCDQYLGNDYRLKALRYYETMSGHNMRWHVDNKNKKEIVDNSGLIFIIYLCDVDEGKFQYIEGSHKFKNINDSTNFNQTKINKDYKHLVKSFNMPKGSLIIYDVRGIHRAEPFVNKNFIRKSLYFQVDNLVQNSEKFFINPNFLKNLNPKKEKILGFGKKNNLTLYPKTNLNRFPINFKIFISIVKWFFYRTVRFILRIEPRNLRKFFNK